MIRIVTTKEEMQMVADFMKRFEDASEFVKVDPNYAADAYWKLIQSGICRVFILESYGTMIGGLGAIKFPELNNGEMTAVECFWLVDPQHRGSGLKLLDEYEKWYESEGCSKGALIHLVDSFPDSLGKIYFRRGYQLVEKHFVRYV
jgi:GNAT superfamily N-acetyltransferase